MTKLNRRRGGRGKYPKGQDGGQNIGEKRPLPEYLEANEIQALIACAEHGKAALLMLSQWRAGLRVSEAVAYEVGDVQLDGEHPTLRVRRGKGHKARVVPLHPELRDAIRNAMSWSDVRTGPLVAVTRKTAWKWVKNAYKKAVERGDIPPGRRIGTHTLRHSAARHWLANRVRPIAINVVSRWLGHANLQQTLIYLEILPDPLGDMERIP